MEASPAPRVVVGLGNPGPHYEGTRHNIGFAVVETVARTLGLAFRREAGPVLVASGATDAGEFLLVLPQAFMNRSGEALVSGLAGRAVPPGAILAVVDDLALPVGALRFRAQGSHGGHNGLRSMIEALGTEAFPRLRIGIGAVQPEAWVDHVLAPFRADEARTVGETVDRSAQGVLDFLHGSGVAALQTKFNRSSPPADVRGTGSPGDTASAVPDDPSARSG